MMRPAMRTALGRGSSFLRSLPRAQGATKRFISTAPPHQKSRSWKSSAVRWGLAGAVVYYYNTSTVFAEEPAYLHAPPEATQENEVYQTVDSVSQQRRSQARHQAAPTQNAPTQSEKVAIAADGQTAAPDSPEALEEEASQQGAFNEETGEINWDCPCLGGMAYGTCGEQFRAAFSCFVFSKEDPKGVDCIEHFKAMQNCFREHPDEYGSELDDDEPAAEQEDGSVVAAEPQTASTQSIPAASSSPAQSDAPIQTQRAQSGPVIQQSMKDDVSDAVPKP